MLQLRGPHTAIYSSAAALKQLAYRHRLPRALQAAAQQLLQAALHNSTCAYNCSAGNELAHAWTSDAACLQQISTTDLLQRSRTKHRSNATQQQQQQEQQQAVYSHHPGPLQGVKQAVINCLSHSTQPLLLQQRQFGFWQQPWHSQVLNSLQQQQRFSTSSSSCSSKSTTTTSSSTNSSGRPKSSKGTLPTEGPAHKTLRALPFVINRADAVAAFTAYHSK
jgi:hypothetical protein